MTDGLHLRGVSARHHHGPEVVHGVDLQAHPGQVLALLGPNGAGKSTLLKAIVGLLPSTGEMSLDGASLRGLADRERARKLAYVPQRTQLTARLSVRSVVDLGRFAHRAPWSRPTRADREAVERALHEADVTALADRPFPALSGGEQQRVLLARALATEAPALLLDEPTSALDVRQVLLLHRILRRLADRGSVVVLVLHDLAEALEHADRAVLLSQGAVQHAGPVEEVVAPGPIRAVYGVDLVQPGGMAYRLPADGEPA